MADPGHSIDAFRTSAPYYEVLFDSAARLKREGPYIKEVYEAAPGPRAVDLACGTGVHAHFLAELGSEITALDLSPEMIAHAQEKRPHPGIHYRQGDMRDLSGGPWDLALCLGNSLSLLGTLDEVAETFAQLHGNLAPGGLFLVQILNYGHATALEPSHRVVRKSAGGVEVVAIKNLVPDGDRTLLSLSFYARSGAEYSSVAETAVLQHLTLDALTSVAARSGFEPPEAHGGYDRSPFDPRTSPDLICLFQRD